MYNIEIYIDTCEDQTASPSEGGPDERSQNDKKDGSHHRLKEAFDLWISSAEERYLRNLEFYNGR